MFTDGILSVGEKGLMGYFEGRQKRSLCNEKDLVAMYDKFKGTSVTISLWCDGVHMVAAKDNSATKRPPTKRKRNEEEVDDTFTELKKKHKDFETPKLCLWARMRANGIHYITDEPPNVPMISGLKSYWSCKKNTHICTHEWRSTGEAWNGREITGMHRLLNTFKQSLTSTSLFENYGHRLRL